MRLGAQLYTVREFTKTLDGFSETLKKIAAIGYTEIQVSGTCQYESEWLNEELSKNSLSCVITHYKPDLICENPTAALKFHRGFGCNRIGIGHFNLDQSPVEELIEKYISAAKEIKAAGGRLYYHNHAFEFKKVNGKRNMDVILESFTPEELGIIMDTYWVQRAGGDPIEWLYRLKGRVDCVHFKDMGYGDRMEVVGEGNMNFTGILKACNEVGVEHILVEQDNCNGEDPFDCLQRSYSYLSALGLK